MLHHVSFAADEPRQAADVLARLIGGRVSRFGPWPGGFIAWSPDGAGTAIEVYPTGTELSPDLQGGQAKFTHNYFAQRGTATHAALSVDRTEAEIADLGAEFGWHVSKQDRGGFDVVEFWVENRVMLEVMTPAMLTRYLQVVNAPRIEAHGTDFDSVTLSVRVPADVSQVWRAWTESSELRRWWAIPAARIDLRIGGAYELQFLPNAPVGARGSENCRILSYVPDRMVSFTWTTPSHLAVPQTHTWVVLTFSEAQDGGTDVELVHSGFLHGPGWQECREYFRQAWRRVLRHLVDHWESTDLTALSDAVAEPAVHVDQVEEAPFAPLRERR